jgi:hypothetical protein
MKPRLANPVGRTCVTRVQFGVTPNCGETRSLTLIRTHYQQRRVPSVSGATPETTRRRRVLPVRRKDFCHA